MSSPADNPAPFTVEDLPLLAALRQHNLAARAVLCTLARRGSALRRADPARARAWIDALSVHPYYKGGQFLFDLLEWEDFMLDGEPPPLLDEASVAAALDRVAQVLGALGAALDGRPIEVPSVPARTTLPAADAGLPLLAGNAYLFQDVVIGVIAIATAQHRVR